VLGRTGSRPTIHISLVYPNSSCIISCTRIFTCALRLKAISPLAFKLAILREACVEVA
jgi:hypothetical protein